MTGMSVEQTRQLKQIYAQDRLDNQLMTSEEFQQRFSVGMRFVEPKAQIFTRLDAEVLHIYEVTKKSELNENQRRLLKNNAGNEEVISCQDPSVASFMNSSDSECVLVLKADVPIAYKNAKLGETNSSGSTNENIVFEDVSRSNSVGLVEIKENVVARQVDVTGALDPNSAIKISDIKGEFFYRRTFEAASNMFLGRTGTSGDMAIIRFELEDDRIVVRNQMSLITYTGQGPKDREELMSFPVKYVRMVRTDAQGSQLTVPTAQQTTKEKAEYAIVDWTRNTIPDSTSPLAFYADGACLQTNSSLNVTDMDMRLNTAGVLNYSLSGSYTVAATDECVARKETNSMISGVTYQFNFNIKERISFMKHADPNSDIQFAENISNTQQGAFNFGLFTLADLVDGEGQLANRNGSEKYMPMVHDFRNGKKVTYHLGGINNADATTPERRQLLGEAAEKVIAEWNATLRLAFKGTPLERDPSQNYLELIVDDANTETHLGDLDRNYIWFQELPAENGLLGVAQPAANPRSGIIQSSNVIVYTGNSLKDVERWLKFTSISREYERNIEDIKNRQIADYELEHPVKSAASDDGTVVNTPPPETTAPGQTARSIQARLEQSSAQMHQLIGKMKMNRRAKRILIGRQGPQNHQQRLAATKQLVASMIQQNILKPQKAKYTVNEQTFIKKLTEIAVNKELAGQPKQFEFAVNEAFIKYGGLSPQAKQTLQQRSQLLAAAIRFDERTKNRPGCFYEQSDRNGINDEAMVLDADPHQNLMLNFKKTVMSTLSHELGHAIGLHHNFKASTDKANYKFDENDKTGRNYSSIMDYMPDIDMNYAGPGPYDAHAMRAGYTGLIELNPEYIKDPEFANYKMNLVGEKKNLASMQELTLKFARQRSYVHLTKDTFNKLTFEVEKRDPKTGEVVKDPPETGKPVLVNRELLRNYEQCDDTGLGLSIMCKQFDVGGSPVEIVQNAIQDYNRSYANRYYVYDKINFGWNEKMQIIDRSIDTFQGLRAFLDEAINTYQSGAGRMTDIENQILDDQLTAARIGYEFFHELIRTPDTNRPVMRRVVIAGSNSPQAVIDQAAADAANDLNKDGLVADDNRFSLFVLPTGDPQAPNFYKLIEERSSYDISALGGDRDKINTIGLNFDKSYALMFLLQASSAPSTVESKSNSQISYTIFEKYFLGNRAAVSSLTVQTMFGILSNNLSGGFFLPSDAPDSISFVELPISVEPTYMLGEDTAVGAILSLAEGRQSTDDLYSETFKVSRSPEASAPKDRINVLKPGQKRGLGDTKVYFASQNAPGAAALVANAARYEYYLTNKASLFDFMKQLAEGDRPTIGAYQQMQSEACRGGSETDACKAANEMSIDQFVAATGDKELIASRRKMNNIAATFVKYLRKANAKNLLLSANEDKAESDVNFDKQVAIIREMMVSQIQVIGETLTALSEDKNPNVKEVLDQLKKNFKAANQDIEGMQLVATAFKFVSEYTGEMKVKLQDQTEITGAVLASVMMNTRRVDRDYNTELELIDKLATYSSIVDGDTVLQ